MGNEHPKQGNNQTFGQNIDKNKLDVIIKQIYFTAQLNRDRRKGQQNTREKELLALIREPTNKRSKDNEYAKAQALTNDVKNVNAHEFVMRYADIIKDNQTVIALSKGDTKKIQDLIPYVESLIWGGRKCNIECVHQLEDFLLASFGPETQAQILEFKQVTPELQTLFDSILPSEREVRLFLIDFCNRHGITLETMQEIGHNLSPTELADLPDPSNKPPTDHQQPQNPYNPGPGNNANYPQPGGGFPQYGGGYPGGPGGFPQQNPYPQNVQGGSYPQFVGYNQGVNPNMPYQNNGYPQQNFPQQQSQQPNFPSQQGQQPGFAQQQSHQPNFSQQQSQQPNFPQQQSQQPNFQSQQGQQPGFPNNQGSFQGGPVQGKSQVPQGNENIKNISNVPAPQDNFDQNKATQTSGAYPDFQRYTNDHPSQAGGVKGTDDLDDLDAKLKNIRNGL